MEETMSWIARVWFGKTESERSREYVEYVRSTGVKDLTGTEGNRGVLVLTRPGGRTSDIGVVSFWDSLRDVERFAGKSVNKAVYYERDREYLLSMEPELLHYEVPIAEGVKFGGAPRATPEAPLEWKHREDARADTPYPGVRVRRLWGANDGARAVLVEIDPGSRFPETDRHDSGPEEVYVVSGVFNDGERDYPAGTFIHNPRGSSHVPQSETGCVLFLFYPEG
jgi:quercetin dioxygenase-like cupin family protein/heme-degrading monooxygenase HmoA